MFGVSLRKKYVDLLNLFLELDSSKETANLILANVMTMIHEFFMYSIHQFNGYFENR